MIVLDNLFILDGCSQLDFNVWVKLVEDYFNGDPMYLPQYVKLFTNPGDEIYCAVYKNDSCCLIYPFILRHLSMEEYVPRECRELCDVTTPYGYGGPWRNGIINDEVELQKIWDNIDKWYCEKKVVSEFIRFSLYGANDCGYPGEMVLRSNHVVVPLSECVGCVWKDLDHKVRTNIRKAQDMGVRVEVDNTGDRIEEFLKIYYNTMDRHNADSSYYFKRSFFESIHHNMPGKCHYYYAMIGNKTISAELVLASSENIYSYLGGTDKNYFNYRSNEYIKYHIIRWGCENRRKFLFLGGGFQHEDSLFKYKKSFAPKGILEYKLGRRIIDAEGYNRLVEAKNYFRVSRGLEPMDSSITFFPLYRA